MLSVPLYVHRTNCSWPPIRSPAHPMPWFYLQREPFGVSTKSIKTLIMLHYNTNMSMLLFECLKFLYTFLKWRYHVIPSKAQLVQCLDSIFSDNRSWRSCPATSSSHIITKLSKTLIMFQWNTHMSMLSLECFSKDLELLFYLWASKWLSVFFSCPLTSSSFISPTLALSVIWVAFRWPIRQMERRSCRHTSQGRC